MLRATLRNRVLLASATFGTAFLVVLVTAPPAGAIFGCGINPLCLIGKGGGALVSGVAGDAITSLAQAVLGALGHAIEWASTLWVGVGTPPIADASGQATGTVSFLQQNLLVYTTGLAVLCTLVGAARIVYHEQKGAQARDLGRYLVTYVLVSGAAAGAASVLIGGSDQMASWFIGQATAGSGFATHLAKLLGLTAASGGGAGFTAGLAGTVATAFIAIALGILAFLSTVIQIILMLVRGGMLVLLVGTLPLAAAFSNTEMGMQWFKKASAWLLAFALYKPAAAIVYAVAFDLAGQQGGGALALLDGVMMLVLAILALPALLRFVVPATSALTGGGGAGGMVAGAAGGALAARMPTGAAPVAAASGGAYGGGGSGGGGPSGSAMPSGASGGSGSDGASSSGSNGGPGPAGGDGQDGAAGPAGQPGQSGAASTAGGGAAAGGAAAAGPAGMGAAAAYQAYQKAKGGAEGAVQGNDADNGGPSGAGGKPT